MGNRLKFSLLEKAVDLAVHHHDTWRIDLGLPYIFHPMEVCKDGSRRGIMDEELLCAFVLHDMIEDTEYTEDQMLKDFGPRVLSIVKEVSKIGIDDEGILVKMEFLKQCTHKSFESLLLKFSDRFCNVNDYKQGKRAWYPGYYAIQAYPLVQYFECNITNIKNLFGHKITMNYVNLVEELRSIVNDQYKIDISDSRSENIIKIDDILLNRKKGIYGE